MSNKNIGIARMLPGSLKPAKPHYVFPAILTTNENWNDAFRSDVSKYNPNGFVYGVGAGSVLATIDSFHMDPKGLVMVDGTPAVVLAAKVLREGFMYHPSWEAFSKVIYKDDKKLDDLETMVFDTEDDKELKRLMERERTIFRERMLEIREGEDRYNDYPLQVIKRRYSTFRRLAQKDNIAVVHADMLNPALLQRVAELPGFRESTNIVYLSNVWDWQPQSSFNKVKLAALQPKAPGRNIFVYSRSSDVGGFYLKVTHERCDLF